MFWEVGALVIKQVTTFCLQWIVLYFSVMPNLTKTFEGISLHFIRVRIV